ncbi:GumC family protein [Bacteroidota bacterium]
MDRFNQENEVHLKEYIKLILINIWFVIPIVFICIGVSIFYAYRKIDIYSSTVTVKIIQNQGDILKAPFLPEIGSYQNDRFIANEIEFMKSYRVREKSAAALLDSLKNKSYTAELFREDDFFFENKPPVVPTLNKVIGMLNRVVSIEQKRGLDIVEVIAESPNPLGAALIANVYFEEYRKQNLEVNRGQLNIVIEFLEEQKSEKKDLLDKAETTLMNYQKQGGIIALNEQATVLIDQISKIEAKRDMAQIELAASDKVYIQYKKELENTSPQIAQYLENLASESYFKELQSQLAKMEVNKDLALLNVESSINDNRITNKYDSRINELRSKLNISLAEYKNGILASSPGEIKSLMQNIIVEKIKNQALRSTISEIGRVLDQYERKFQKLPKTSLELAQLQRSRESLDKLYRLVEEKYQEALINEKSMPGNILLIDEAQVPVRLSKPNRVLIIILGLVIGFGLAFGYVMMKNYFKNVLVTPEDLEKHNVSMLAWIPKIEELKKNGKNGNEFIVFKYPNARSSEAFRTLRTRIHYSHLSNKALKVLLITSPSPQDGKTVISLNLAGTFANMRKKTLLIDCDLRKPGLHSFFYKNRAPGLVDYLFRYNELDEILYDTPLKNLYFIAAGTSTTNPADVLESERMRNLISDMKKQFDVIILDAVPMIVGTDSEIMANIADATILVVSSGSTKFEVLDKSIEILNSSNAKFIGTVLNNFAYKNGYGEYYKYYYYYYGDEGNGKKGKRRSRRRIVNNKNINGSGIGRSYQLKEED